MKLKVIKEVQFTVFSMEQLQETVKNSDFEHIQISGGEFSGHNIQFELHNSLVCSGTYSQTILAKASLPAKTLTIGFILDNVEPGILLGHSFNKGELLVLPENSELHYFMPMACHDMMIMLDSY